jgi:excisionase family DNA binding protein
MNELSAAALLLERLFSAPREPAGAAGTIIQVAERLQVAEDTVKNLIDEGRMPHVRLAPRTIRIVWRELEQWLADESHASTVLAELEADGADTGFDHRRRRRGAA